MIRTGEPGIGKSRILLDLRRPKYVPVWLWRAVARRIPGITYFDCPNKDLGDLAMPSVEGERRPH